MSQLFDENGMLILRQQAEPPNKNVRKETKYVKYGSNFQKVREYLSEYNPGDKVKIGVVRKSTEINSLTHILIVLKRDGFIDYERSGRNRRITILRKI